MSSNWLAKFVFFASAGFLVSASFGAVAVAEPLDDEDQELDDLIAGSSEDDDYMMMELTDWSLADLLERDMERSIAPGLGSLAMTLNQGELLLDYSLDLDSRQTNLDGRKRVASGDIVKSSSDDGYGFLHAPTEMSSVVHTLSISYAPIDLLTVTGTFGYVENSMEHLLRIGNVHDGRSDSFHVTDAQGISDPTIKAMVRLLEGENHRIHGTLGTSLPLGSIDERGPDSNISGREVVLPYPMQPGSGTFDLISGVTYRGLGEMFGWGVHLEGAIPLGQNEQDYSLGQRYELSAWGSALWTEALSSFFILQADMQRNITGQDPRIPTDHNPMGDPSLQAGYSVNATLGLALDGEIESALEDLRMELFAGAPLFQYRDGPQISTDLMAGFSLKYLFDFQQ